MIIIVVPVEVNLMNLYFFYPRWAWPCSPRATSRTASGRPSSSPSTLTTTSSRRRQSSPSNSAKTSRGPPWTRRQRRTPKMSTSRPPSSTPARPCSSFASRTSFTSHFTSECWQGKNVTTNDNSVQLKLEGSQSIYFANFD